MTKTELFHVFVGSEVGLFKGVNIEKGTFSNLNPLEGLDKNDEVTTMCWEDGLEKKVYSGNRGQVVKVFDCEKNCFTSTQNYAAGEGQLKEIFHCNGKIVTAVESGIVKLWTGSEQEDVHIDTGGNLCRMAVNPFSNSLQVGTGGEENDLKVWDLQAPKSPIFQAKNVKNDFLDLRVPVWITDLKFRSCEKIVTATRHHQIRLYDTKAQRRPVIDMEFERYPLMCLSLAHNEHQLVVASSRGRMALIDLRKKLLVHVFKGFAGSIRSVQCHPTLPLVASCGLDRFLRIHDLNQHKLLKKIYLKTRLNCLLLRTELSGLEEQPKLKCSSDGEKLKPVTDAEEEAIWDAMAVVKDKKNEKRSLNAEVTTSQKRKRKNLPS